MDLVFDHKAITKKFKHALSTGNWPSASFGLSARTGVAQQLKKDTGIFSGLSYMRKCVATILPRSKETKPRLLHNTHYGYICPSETPEGEKIGLVKSLSLLCKITG